MDRLGIYQYILSNLEDTYKRKNNDYGNSVGDTYEKFGCASFLVRITDKYNRLMTLCDPNAPQQMVKDEKIDDTILDLANYCLLWLVEREYSKQSATPEKNIVLQTKNPASNNKQVANYLTQKVNQILNELNTDELKGIINIMDAKDIKYHMETQYINGNHVKMVLVVDDLYPLTQILTTMGY